MRQSALRIVFALLMTAVGASLMIGTVYAEGPAPEPPGENPDVPPGLNAPPIADPSLYSSLPDTVETWDVSIHETTVPSAAIDGVNAGVAASTGHQCRNTRFTRKKIFWTQTEWCFDGTLIVRGWPVITHGTHRIIRLTVENGFPQEIEEVGKNPRSWRASGGYLQRTHHDKGLADHRYCVRNLAGSFTEQVCDTWPDSLRIDKWQFGTGAYHPTD